jgi:hypothetical protein
MFNALNVTHMLNILSVTQDNEGKKIQIIKSSNFKPITFVFFTPYTHATVSTLIN